MIELTVDNPFPKVSEVSDIANNILRKRYFKNGETSWEEVVNRVINHVMKDQESIQTSLTHYMILNRYFIPNSPCLVNAGVNGGGLSACFVVDFPDTIEGIYKTKLDFALVAKKGGGCGTTLSKLRPEGSVVNGSSHGYAGGPVKFFDTICHDMTVMTQAGFREMAMMGTLSVYHPDIVKFITSKEEEGKMHTTNISVVVDDHFMETVEKFPEVKHNVYHPEWGSGYIMRDPESGKYYPVKGESSEDTLSVGELFNLIVEHAWRNGEPGILFYENMNNSPYKETGQEILATNPCGEQGLPFNGVCNLGSIDISKFLDNDNELDFNKLSVAVKLSIRFLDRVIDTSSFPTKEIDEWAKNNRPVGLGIMGLADYYLKRKIAYGSDQALEELGMILSFMYNVAINESIELGEELGVPLECQKLEIPRRNITVLSIAPTGTISLLAGCNSGIEPVFSEITIRNDKTGSYQMDNISADADYFRCAVSTNGAKEVTWREHVMTQAVAQDFVDSGVSKTINFPTHTHKETISDAFILAWKEGIKGITVYRNGSRNKEVLSPKNLKKDKCPLCGKELIHESGCRKCPDVECGFSVCDVA